MRPILLGVLLTIICSAAAIACGGVARQGAFETTTAAAPEAIALPPLPLANDYFVRDGSGSIGEDELKEVLAAPVLLEAEARIGVIQVADGYQTDPGVPLVDVPAALTDALQAAGLFDVATEISTDWPADRGISGLRELAARYRSDYVLLYRHRFVDETYANPWGWLYPTVVGIFVAPAHTLEAIGVLEATLFDVKTGTILFTVFERVRGASRENIWHKDRKRRDLKEELMGDHAAALSEAVVSQCRRLAAARDELAKAAPAAPRAAPEEPERPVPPPVPEAAALYDTSQ